jgi:hypothetical protein
MPSLTLFTLSSGTELTLRSYKYWCEVKNVEDNLLIAITSIAAAIAAFMLALPALRRSSFVQTNVPFMRARPASGNSWKRQFDLLLWKNMLLRRRSIGGCIVSA